MAYLHSHSLTLEVRLFPGLEDNQLILYEIFFRYKGEPIIRDELLKRTPKLWENRSPGALLARETGACTLLPVLREVMENKVVGYWQPEEPDVTFVFYPGMVFPFIKKVNSELDSPIQIQTTSVPALKDSFTIAVVVMVDAYNFGSEFTYSGQGPALIMHVNLSELTQFHDEFQAELETFIEEYGPFLTPLDIKEDL
jgi:hypothetical protein